MGSVPPPPEGLLEGQTLAGKYHLLRQLGVGGMCLVFEAEHVHLKQGVALKLLKPELAKDPDSVTRFSREAQAAAKLRSANVARVYDVDTLPDGQPYITMELLVGHDLGTELTKRGALGQTLAVDYVRQACAGISEAHALGIIHRDLKPENLFLTELGEMTDRKLVKILDFGIAKNVSESNRRLTAPDAVFGTVDYMSPEQIRSASTVDLRTDLWSLGVILYELLTGRLPYTGDARSVIAQIASDPVPPPSRHTPGLPPSLVAIVMKALSKDPAARFQSAEEFRAALEPFADDIEPITGVLARLPPQSMPRRTLDAPIRPVSIPPDAVPREMRTNVSWAGEPASKGVSRVWIALALAIILGAGGYTAYMKRDLIAARFGAAPPVAAAAPPPPATEPAATPPAPPPPAPPTSASTESPPSPGTASAAATASDAPPVVSVSTMTRTRPSPTTRPKAAPARKPTASPAEPSPSLSPSPTPSPALPKHL